MRRSDDHYIFAGLLSSVLSVVYSHVNDSPVGVLLSAVLMFFVGKVVLVLVLAFPAFASASLLLLLLSLDCCCFRF